MAIRLQVRHGDTRVRAFPWNSGKYHLLLLSQARQAKLGRTKRVCEGSITLDDYDAQSLEVARQVGTGLVMIMTDHLK